MKEDKGKRFKQVILDEAVQLPLEHFARQEKYTMEVHQYIREQADEISNAFNREKQRIVECYEGRNHWQRWKRYYIGLLVGFCLGLFTAGVAKAEQSTRVSAITIPPGESVTYIEQNFPQDFRGFPVKNITPGSRDLNVQWKGSGPDIAFAIDNRDCHYKDVIGLASATITIIARHENCGRNPRVTLFAVGAKRSITVGVRQSWEQGDHVTTPPEATTPIDDPNPPQFAPGTVTCVVDPDGDGPEPFQPAEVESVETDPPSPNIFRVSFTPPVPVTP
jgi:hypothetical protein